MAGGRLPLHAELSPGRSEYVLAIRAGSRVPVPVTQYSPVAELDDLGFGIFGQGTVTLSENLDVIAGARLDYEDKSADLEDVLRSGDRAADGGRRPKTVSRTCLHSSRWRTAFSRTGTSMRRSRADSRPAGSTPRPRPAARHTAKSGRGISRAATNAVVQRARLVQRRCLLHRLERPAVERSEPERSWAALHRECRRSREQGGRARRRGPASAPAWTCSAAFGYTHARFSDNSTAAGSGCVGQQDPQHPGLHGQHGRAVCARGQASATLYGRADVVFYGAFNYDESNTQAQDAYSLMNLRGGVRWQHLLRRGLGEERVRHGRTFRSPSRTARSRRQDTSARTARRGPSACAPGSRSEPP